MDLGIGDRWSPPLNAVLVRPRAAGAGDEVSGFAFLTRTDERTRETSRKAGRMSAQLGIGRAVGGAILAAWFGLAAHSLSVRDFGELTLVLSLGSLVSIGTDLGLSLAMTKLSCDYDELDRAAVEHAMRRRVMAGLVASAVMVVLWFDSESVSKWWLAALYGVSVTVTPLTSSFLALLRGRAEGSVEAVYEVLSKIALPVAAASALILRAGLAGVLVAYALVDSLSALVVAAVSRKHLHFTNRRDTRQEKALGIKATFPLAAAGVFGSAYDRVDVWLVAAFLGSSKVALFAAAYRVYDTVLLAARAVESSSIAAAGRDLHRNCRKTALALVRKVVVMTLPLAVLGAVAAPALLRTVFGHSYGEASGVVNILMLATVPGAALAVVTPLVLIARREFAAKCTGFGLLGHVAATAALVPVLGMEGVAVAFLFTELALLVLFWRALPIALDPSSEPTPDAPDESVQTAEEITR